MVDTITMVNQPPIVNMVANFAIRFYRSTILRMSATLLTTINPRSYLSVNQELHLSEKIEDCQSI